MIDSKVSAGKLLKVNGDPLKVLESLNPSPIAEKFTPTNKDDLRKPDSIAQSSSREPQNKSATGILTLPTQDSLAEIMKPKAA